MVKQLYCSELHSKNIRLSYILAYIMKFTMYTQKTSSLLIVLTAGALLIMSRVPVAVFV